MKMIYLLRWSVFVGTFLGSIWIGSELDLPVLSYCSPIFACGAAAALELIVAAHQQKGDRRGWSLGVLVFLPLVLIALDQSFKFLAQPPTVGPLVGVQSLIRLLPNFGSLLVIDVQRNFSFVALVIFSAVFILFLWLHRNWLIVAAMGLILGGGVSNGLDFVLYGRSIAFTPLHTWGVSLSTNLADISIYMGLIFFAAGGVVELRRSIARRNRGVAGNT